MKIQQALAILLMMVLMTDTLSRNLRRKIRRNTRKRTKKFNEFSNGYTLSGNGKTYTIGKKVGEGAYGKTFIATYTDNTQNETTCALKQQQVFSSSTDEYKILKNEREVNLKLKQNFGKTDFEDRIAYAIEEFEVIYQKENYAVFRMIFLPKPISLFLSDPEKYDTPVNAFRIKVSFFMSFAHILDKFHQKGFIHNDLKDANLLVNSSNDVSLIDFGFTEYVENNENGKMPGTGSPLYKSPEKFFFETYNKSADVWSFGIIMMEYFKLNKKFFQIQSIDSLRKYLKDSDSKFNTDFAKSSKDIGLSNNIEYESEFNELVGIVRSALVNTPVYRPSMEYIYGKLTNLYDKLVKKKDNADIAKTY